MMAPNQPFDLTLIEPIFRAVDKAAALIREHAANGLSVDTKPDGSPVTAADRGAEELLRARLAPLIPGAGFLGEEFGAEAGDGARWILDPIDGTKNYVAGIPYFATLLALEVEEKLVFGLVHAPALRQSWWAARGHGAWHADGCRPDDPQRRRLRVANTERLADAFVCHGGLRHFQTEGLWQPLAALVGDVRRTRGFGDWWGHVLVAEGKCDAMIDPRVALHDVAALKVIVEEAGGAMACRGDRWLVAGQRTVVISGVPAIAQALARRMFHR